MNPGRTRLSAAALLSAAVFSATLPGCNVGTRECTMMGCINEVRVELADLSPEPAERIVARFCLDDDCSSRRFRATERSLGDYGPGGLRIKQDGDSLVVSKGLPGEDWDEATVYEVSLDLRVGDREPISIERDVRLESYEINGPGCGLCWGAKIDAGVTVSLGSE